MPFGRITAALVCLGCLTGLVAYAQAPVVVVDREYEIKAKYLYFLTAFIQPKTDSEAAPPRKRIAVIGKPPQKFTETTQLQQKIRLAETDVPIEWKTFANVDAFRADSRKDWDIVFLIEAAPSEIDATLTTLQNSIDTQKPLLIVTEQEDQFRKLAAVNFYEDKAANRVKIQVREQSLIDRGLQADAGFLKNDAVIFYPVKPARS